MARSLTKHKKDGALYERPPDIETSIDVALSQGVAAQRARALVTDRASPDYLRSECLVHLIRNARQTDDHPMMNALLPMLLKRCEATLVVKVSDGDFANAAEIREEVMEHFVDLFFQAPDGDELDFYECRFNAAFRALRIDVVRREITRTKRIARHSDTAEEDRTTSEDVSLVRISKKLSAPATQESSASLAELYEAINELPPEERKAVILCHRLGYEEESEDPDKVTAATLCGVTGRTIRNRLSRAASKLSRFNEEV